MERKVPSTASEEIELYLRTIYSLLRSTADVQIRTLEEVHTATNSLLHLKARSEQPDVATLIYTLLRLPECVPQVHTVILGQSVGVFRGSGYKDIENWQEVTARARRRRCYFNGNDTLACYIASRSDIDDVIPSLTAFQIEWNKLHFLLQTSDVDLNQVSEAGSPAQLQLADTFGISLEDLERLQVAWGGDFSTALGQIREKQLDLRVRLLNGSLSEYWRATRLWMDNIIRECPLIGERPVYFVSSNTHSITNLLTGYALQRQEELIVFLEDQETGNLLDEWGAIKTSKVPSSPANFLYYVMKKLQATNKGRDLLVDQARFEQERGVHRIPSTHTFDVEAQAVELARLDPDTIDRRLCLEDMSFLKKSDALILNIDYPLGLAAYNILSKVAEQTGRVLGVYITGKAATLNGVRGDVMIPNVMQDEHSQNTYLFPNAFSARDVQPYLTYGTVLDNQKGMSVLGTFLQNAHIMDVIYREGYTDIEMEAGPYLSAVTEMYRPRRHPVNEIVNLYGAPFDLGILHYVSDKPLSKGSNLGAGTLSYFGMDSTYACSVAILKRIFQMERDRIG